MKVKEIEEKYKCGICGNEIMVTRAGGGELACCGRPMEKVIDVMHINKRQLLVIRVIALVVTLLCVYGIMEIPVSAHALTFMVSGIILSLAISGLLAYTLRDKK